MSTDAIRLSPPAITGRRTDHHRSSNEASMTVIEVFADVTCPFTHVGLRRFVERRGELGRMTWYSSCGPGRWRSSTGNRSMSITSPR